MLEIESVEWKNFLSYGNYLTKLDLSSLGQCLITGEVIGEESEKEVYDDGSPIKIKRSNGAGKSTIPSVLQWTLFGRTMHDSNPSGDGIMNWFTGKPCYAKVTMKNGDSITRTRNTDGNMELSYIKDGDENTILMENLSTAKNQQKKLAREFSLDWDILCGSAFFNQYGKAWMEMADASRKKAMERVLHVDRFIYYSKVAKEKCDRLDSDCERFNIRISELKKNIAHYEEEIERLKENLATYDDKKKARYKELLEKALENIKARDALKLPNLESLEKKWGIISEARKKINEHEESANSNNSKISDLTSDINSFTRKIKIWEEKAGRVCVECEQDIPKDHTDSKIGPIKENKTKAEKELEELVEKKTSKLELIKKSRELLKEKEPKHTLSEAREIYSEWNQFNDSVKRLKKQANEVKDEENPYGQSIESTKKKIEQYRREVEDLEKEVERNRFLYKHYRYTYKAYHDRSKVKKYIFSDHIPYINSRLKHYLDVFGLDIQIELTPSLGIKSNMWSYKYESGGERKRTDVAFMFAMFDFHEELYGRQCNILVLDEVDGRLDDDGIDSLISIIKNDLPSKAETVLVISHRNMMFDTFPSEIKVTRSSRFSQLEVVS